MRFKVGQKFRAVQQSDCVADIVSVGDDGDLPWFQMRDANGQLLSEGHVNVAQLPRHWVLEVPVAGDEVVHSAYRIVSVKETGGYCTQTRRVDGRHLVAGLSMGESAITHHSERPEYALAAAREAIDSGEVR